MCDVAHAPSDVGCGAIHTLTGVEPLSTLPNPSCCTTFTILAAQPTRMHYYEVEYSVGADTMTEAIYTDSRPSKREALEQLTNPSLAMVPPEDVSIEGITKKEDHGESFDIDIPGL